MRPSASHLLIAVQRAEHRLVGPCERMDRETFRVTLREELPRTHEYAAFFRDAAAKGAGLRLLARVESVYHAFDQDDGFRTTFRFVKPDPLLLDRLMKLGFKHGVVDQQSLGAATTPRPVRQRRSGLLQVPKDGVFRGALQGERHVWSLDRLRPGEVPIAVQELIDGVLMVRGLRIDPADLDKVTVRIASEAGALNVPCEVRYQVETGPKTQAGVVLGLAPVPPVVRTRLAEIAAQRRTQTGPVGRAAERAQTGPMGRTPTGPMRRTTTGPVGRTPTGPVGRTPTGPMGRTPTGPMGRPDRPLSGLERLRQQGGVSGTSTAKPRPRRPSNTTPLSLGPLPLSAPPADTDAPERVAMPSTPPATPPPETSPEAQIEAAAREARLQAALTANPRPARPSQPQAQVFRRARRTSEPDPPPAETNPPPTPDPMSLLREQYQSTAPAAGIRRRRTPKPPEDDST